MSGSNVESTAQCVPGRGARLRAYELRSERLLPSNPVLPRTPTELIRERAYQIYQGRRANAKTGDALSDWIQAEQELNNTCLDGSLTDRIEMKAQVRGEALMAGED